MLWASADLAAIAPRPSYICAVAEYLAASGNVKNDGGAVNKYPSFNQIEE